MSEYLPVVALVVISLAAVVMTIVRLPGPWIIVMSAIGYGWWTGWKSVGLNAILVLLACAAAGEIIELIASAVVARQAGASRSAGWGGLVGGILGLFFLTFLVPIPLIGSVIGAIAGCFAGAVLVEFHVRNRIDQATRVGVASVIGFVLGMMAKTLIAFAMSAILITIAIRSVWQ